MLTKHIQQHICQVELLKWNLPCENVKFLTSNFEYDVLSLNNSGFLLEFEVKISKSDFKADSKKRKTPYYQKRIPKMTPNYFYYVCPEGLIKVDELPDYAWLIYINKESIPHLNVLTNLEDNCHITIIKRAPLLHKEKRERQVILEKFTKVTAERKYFWWRTLFTYKANNILEKEKERKRLKKSTK